MLKEIVVRDARIEDLPFIVNIYNSTIPSRMVTADTELVSIESKEAWFHEHIPNFRPLMVMEHNGTICGWLSFQSFYGRPAYNATAEISIYIHTEYRGQGLGSFALEYAISYCPKLGLHTLLAFIFGHNDPSLRLFQKYGFENWGHFPRIAELDGIERDLIILGKRIDS
ncbi:GNAT family N-acetyltransferase [Ectobacillus polymachus]|uniref:GNAT family N-acetyltransferase n=1 Tax=Ectobacillus polymachus TaxID=1508806 RepID=UPI003A84F547